MLSSLRELPSSMSYSPDLCSIKEPGIILSKSRCVLYSHAKRGTRPINRIQDLPFSVAPKPTPLTGATMAAQDSSLASCPGGALCDLVLVCVILGVFLS